MLRKTLPMYLKITSLPLYFVQFLFIFSCCNALIKKLPRLEDEDTRHGVLRGEKEMRQLQSPNLQMPNDELADKILLHYAELSRNRAVDRVAIRAPDDKWTYKNVVDEEGKIRKLTMDVYYPTNYFSDPNSAYPVVVYFHGGGWISGTTAIGWGHCSHYRSVHNAICVSVDYRLGDGLDGIVRSIVDAKAAIRYLRHNSESLRIDSNRISAMGDSSGGHLAAATATVVDASTNDDNFYELGISAIPDMVIMLNPFFECFQDPLLYTNQDVTNLVWPEAVVRSRNAPSPLPPMLTFIGEADGGYPFAQSFHESLVANGSQSLIYITKKHLDIKCAKTNCLRADHGVYSTALEDGNNPNTYYAWHIIGLFMTLNGILPSSESLPSHFNI
mmetsp:Transcript_18006/g.22046  ORF Transcript_18006/g.22046 Transcript_18006/m.22046 type:complete len:387 (+) Transcript_18006:88-1248(+)